MPQSVKANLLAAFRYLLKPLVRLALKNGVTFPEFSEVLKQAYVDVAFGRLRAAGAEGTEEGVSVMTRVAIEDVRNIADPNAGAKLAVVADESNPLPRILNAWHTDIHYTGPYGVLKDLEFSRLRKPRSPGSDAVLTGSSGPSFTTLVATYCPGLSPETALQELIDAKCVVAVGEHYYRAVKRTYVPDPLSAASIMLFARVVHNLCEAAEVNLRSESSSGRGLMQRNVYTRYGVTEADLKNFDLFLRTRGQLFIDDIDTWLTARDKDEELHTIKTGIGLYHFIVNDDDELELSKRLPN